MSAVVSGCSHSPVEQYDGIPINAVTRRVQCEVAEATTSLIDPNDIDGVKGWKTAMTLTLSVDSAGSVAPSITALGIYHTGTYSANFGAGVAGKATRTALVKIEMDIFPTSEFEGCKELGYNPLTQELGLKQWITRAMTNDAGDYKFNKEKGIGYTLEFEVEAKAGIEPIIKVEHSQRSTGVSAAQKRTHTLDLALLPLYPAIKTISGRIRKSNEGPVSQIPGISDDSRQRLNNILQDLNFQKLQRRF